MAFINSDWETNKNAVIFHYPHLYPKGPAYVGERPISCVCLYKGFKIRAGLSFKGFIVDDGRKVYKKFSSLNSAREFIHSLVFEKNRFFEK